MPPKVVSGISSCFQLLFQCQGQVAHVLLTRSPLVYPRRGLTVRLACVKHAASVRPEPGSNSPLKNIGKPQPRRTAAETVKNNELDLDMRPNWVNQFQSQRNHTRPEQPHRCGDVSPSTGSIVLFGIDF